MSSTFTLGIDTGGTFTDFALLDPDGQMRIAKVPTLAEQMEQGLGEGLSELDVSLTDVSRLVHGTTVCTNALLQRRGALVGMLTTAGFRDVLAIGRTARSVPYVPAFTPVGSLVPPEFIREIEERTTVRGEILLEPDPTEVLEAVASLVRMGIEALVIGFIWSVTNDSNEHNAKKAVESEWPKLPAFCSADVLAEFREYERFSVTSVNAYLAPTIRKYLGRFSDSLTTSEFSGDFALMQSNGGLMAPETASTHAVRTILSGPAGGLIAAREIGGRIGEFDLITLDTGGTSSDVSMVVEGQILVTRDREVEGFPIRVPMIDIHTVGAGGGSIARLDVADAIRVGPQSAGGLPGPASYGRGGEEPTLTDAYVLTGKLGADSLLGGAMRLFPDLARQAMQERIAEPLAIDVEEAADGVSRIAEELISQAIRVVSVQCGYDPRDFALFAFGGMGPLQSAVIADRMQIRKVVVPPYPGVTAAIGLLHADVTHDFVRTRLSLFEESDPSELTLTFGSLEEQAAAVLERERVPRDAWMFERSVDLRYRGQAYEITTPVASSSTFTSGDVARAAEEFHDLHLRLRGVDLRSHGIPIELVALRVRGVGIVGKPRIDLVPTKAHVLGDSEAKGSRSVLHDQRWHRVPTYDRGAMRPGCELAGPAVVESLDSTIFVPPEWYARVDGFFNVILEKGGM